jgi:rod shape-determining protein MreD
MRIKTTAAFWISFLIILFGPIFIPKLHLFYFAPYLIICLYTQTRISVLWKAYLCGLILDLLSSSSFFGFSSLNYCLVCWVLYGQKRHFFEDHLSTLPVMTFLFSFLSTLVSCCLFFYCEQSFPFSWSWIATDLFLMPLLDSAYALLVFSLPFQIIYKIRRMRLRKT